MIVLFLFFTIPANAKDSFEPVIQTGHKYPVFAIAISDDNKNIITGSFDQTIKIWNTKTGGLIKTIANGSPVYSVSMTKDRKYIVSGSDDRTIKIWSFDTGKMIRKINAYSKTINYAAVYPDNKSIISYGDNTLKFWELNTGKLVKKMKIKGLAAISITSDGKYIISGNADKTISVIDLVTGKLIRKLKGHNDCINSTRVSLDGKYIVSCSGYISLDKRSKDNSVKVWELNTGNLVRTFTGHASYISSVAISPDNQYVISGSGDNTIKIWSLKSGKPVNKLKGHYSEVCALAVTDDNQLYSQRKLGLKGQNMGLKFRQSVYYACRCIRCRMEYFIDL